jgi:aspartyl-tRNA(Asn)/glutamyl-tRNA(Gln) amidotransferase subunit A
VLPTTTTTVPTVDAAQRDPEQALSAAHTAFANWYGLPAISVPCGFDAHGLPLGLQIVGTPGGDDVVLGVARRIESVLGVEKEHPIR